jgi:hypothetical protein
MTEVTLSRRNLLYLLAKLEQGERRPMVSKISRSSGSSAVFAERDEDHYQAYSPANVDPSVADLIEEINNFLKSRRNNNRSQS